jgi:glutamine synthetase
MAAVIAAVDEYGDLMRMSIASPGNDFRLGAMEAPPAIVSTYLGADMTSYLEAFLNGSDAKYEPGKKTIDLGVAEIVPFEVPAEDRNRTSPFPYGGARFEFRAVGSAQNVSMVNTVLNTIVAEKFGQFADAIDNGAKPEDVAREALKKHWRVIFNGDNYCAEAQQELTDRGLWRIDSGVEAIATLTSPKNIALFEKMGVLTAAECEARQTVLLDHYTGTVEMEALTMVDMINQHVIPSCKAAGFPIEDLQKDVGVLKGAVKSIHEGGTSLEKARIARTLRLDTMVGVREHCDNAEAVIPANLWTLATYKELLFLDSHTDPAHEATYYDE